MKALSLKEPWLSFIVEGRKTVETRKWRTTHRGDLLLCGSARPCGRFSGLAACIVHITTCRPMTTTDVAAACCELYDGAWVWEMEDVRVIEPFPVKGRIGLFDVEADIVAL